MESKKCGLLHTMAVFFLFTLISMYNFTPSIAPRHHYDPIVYKNTPLTSESAKGDAQTYIVHVRPQESTVFWTKENHDEYYRSFLPLTIASSDEPKQIIHSFAVKLTEEELKTMEKKDGSSTRETKLQLHTIHTPDSLNSVGKGDATDIDDEGLRRSMLDSEFVYGDHEDIRPEKHFPWIRVFGFGFSGFLLSVAAGLGVSLCCTGPDLAEDLEEPPPPAQAPLEEPPLPAQALLEEPPPPAQSPIEEDDISGPSLSSSSSDSPFR